MSSRYPNSNNNRERSPPPRFDRRPSGTYSSLGSSTEGPRILGHHPIVLLLEGPKPIFEALVSPLLEPLEVEAVFHALVTRGTAIATASVTGKRALLRNLIVLETMTDQIGSGEIVILDL